MPDEFRGSIVGGLDRHLDSEPVPTTSTTTSRRRRRTDWRLGGSEVRKWDARVLAVMLACVGLGVLGSVAVDHFASIEWAARSGFVLYLFCALGLGYAYKVARPARLMRAKSTDLLWGISLGLILRILQGALSNANAHPFPTAGNISSSWWYSVAISGGLVAPLIEELTFRAVLLVSVFQLLRRSVGSLAAGATSLLVSSSVFVLLHAAFNSLSLGQGIQLFVVGAVCASVVLLTGRIWGAVLVHFVYNASYLLLVLVGSYLA